MTEVTLNPCFLLVSERENYSDASQSQIRQTMSSIKNAAKGRELQLIGTTDSSTVRIVEVWDMIESWSKYIKDALIPGLLQSKQYPNRITVMDCVNHFIDPQLHTGNLHEEMTGYIMNSPNTNLMQYQTAMVEIMNGLDMTACKLHAAGFCAEGNLLVTEFWTDPERAERFYLHELPRYLAKVGLPPVIQGTTWRVRVGAVVTA